MKSLRARKGAGTALVLTLFFILLISALVVALLISMRLDRSSTQGYYQSARVQELANGALEEILSDLRSEIDAGSRQASAFANNGKRVYVPVTNLASQPVRIGFAPGTNGDYATDIETNRIAPSLVRVSRANVDTNIVFPTAIYDPTKLPPQRASAVSSTNYSYNGRTISPKRWNSSFMLSGATNPPARFATNTPDWVYVTRGGSRIVTDTDVPSLKPSDNLDDTNTLVGRYSYIVYDSGGLIDVNCAGYPSVIATQTNGAAAIRGKSSAIYAALSSLPGMTNKVVEIDALVAWRGRGSLAAATNNFLTAATNWAKHGYLQATNGDSPLLSRKDLIDYFTKKVGTTTPLPYLGTFSRHLSAPSARPAIPAGASPGYYTPSSIDATGLNCDLANARFLTPSTVAHYADDGTSKTYTVKAGAPLLQSRFSLARLAWLQEANPETGSGPSKAAAIKACFGLVWDFPRATPGTSANGGNKCWNYVGPEGLVGSPTGTIKTLDQVAAAGREPDFFELLKAAILSGSLGKDAGPAAFNNGLNNAFNGEKWFSFCNDPDKFGPGGVYSYTYGPLSTTPSPARISDMQIIRIGANIIDQYDPDSFPTAIYFKYATVGANDPASNPTNFPMGIFGPATMAYGIENLPYLHSVRQIIACPDENSKNTLGGWRQPFLWNPHQPPAQDLTSRPSNYQIRAYGSAVTSWQYAFDPAGYGYKSGQSHVVNYYQANSDSEFSDVGTLNFTLNDAISKAAFCFYDKPYPLVRDSLSNVTATSPFAGNIATATVADYGQNLPVIGIPNHFVAFSTGMTPEADEPAPNRKFWTANGGSLSAAGKPINAPGITYVLGWTDSANRFHPYSYITGAFTYGAIKLENDAQQKGSANYENIGTDVWLTSDPRSERFSVGRNLWGGFQETLSVYRGNGQYWAPCARPNDPGFIGVGYPWQTYSYRNGDLMVNKEGDATHTCYYKDPDGVVRPGDAFYGTPSTGDGMMTFLNAGTPSGTPVAVGDNTAGSHARRPVILNRPFQSVGELGYVFRDQPFKTLDFFSDKSADTALLDVFCLHDVATVTPDRLIPLAAGRVNPNAASTPVLKALLQGGAKKELDSNYNLQAESEALAKAFANKIMQTNSFVPLDGYRNLAPALVDAMRSASSSSADRGNKTYLEAPLRAISEISDFRTWNLMIDIIAQSGQMVPNAKKLNDFTVQAECRVWLHVSIDRYTGEVIARQLEPVYE